MRLLFLIILLCAAGGFYYYQEEASKASLEQGRQEVKMPGSNNFLRVAC